jgi:hypothetical protein
MSDQDPELDLQHVQNWQSEQLRNASAIISDAQANLSFSLISPTSMSTNGYRSHRSERQFRDYDSAPKPTLLRTGRDIGIHRPPAATKKKLQTKNPNPHLISARTYWVQCHRYTTPTNCLRCHQVTACSSSNRDPTWKTLYVKSR